MGTNGEFQFGGINHIALVSSDMARTVDFYTNVLGMNMERWVDAVEVFFGTLELAERTKELRRAIPFSTQKLRVVVEASIKGFTDLDNLPFFDKYEVTHQEGLARSSRGLCQMVRRV